MYSLDYNIENTNISFVIQLENLEDLLRNCPIYDDVKRFSLADIYDDINYGITIFKPLPEKQDFLFIYSNKIFWDYFKPNAHQYIVGRLFNQVFPKFHEAFKEIIDYSSLKENTNKRESFFKLYHDDTLLKVWSQVNIIENGLIYSCTEDKTELYLEKQEKHTIFDYSPFPIFNINKNYKVTKINQAFKEFFGFTLEDLNSQNLDDFVSTYNSKNSKAQSFKESVRLVFNQKILFEDSEVGLTVKNGEYKWILAHITLINEDLVQVSIQDLSELKESRKVTHELGKYLSDIEDMSKTSFNIKDDEGFHWTDEIFEILEVDPQDRVYDTKTNYIYNYATPESINKIEEALTRISFNNPVTINYEVKTAKGNTKYLRAYLKLREYEGRILRLGFTQDVTKETIASKEALDLKESIDGIQELSKIVIGTFINGEYKFTSEIYNILGVSPEDYTDTDLLSFVLPEDQEMINDSIAKVTPENPNFQYVFRFQIPNGEIKYMKTFNKAKFNENGELMKVIGFQQDITDEINAQNQAIRLNENFELMQESSKIFFGSYENGEYNYTAEIYNILKINPDDYPKDVNLMEKFVIPKDKNIWAEYERISPENTEYVNKFRVKNTEGEIKHLLEHIRALYDDNNELIRIIALIQDITDEELAKQDALRLNENFEVIQGSTKMFIAEYKDGQYSYTNEVYNILEINPEDYPDKSILFDEFVLPEDKSTWKAYKGFTPENSEYVKKYRVRSSKGEIKHLLDHTKAIFNENGELIRVIGLVQDVTDEEVAKNKALRLEKNFSILGETSKIFISEYENGIYSYTDEIYNILDYSPIGHPETESVLGKFVLPEDRDKWSAYQRLTPEDSEFTKKYRVRSTKGEIKYFLNHTKGLFDENGEMLRVIAFVQDVTDEEIAKQDALRLNDDYDLIQESNKVFLAEYQDGKYTFTNELYNRLGIKKEDYPDTVDIVPLHVIPEDKEGWGNAMSLSPENPYEQVTYRLKSQSGEIIYIYCTNRAKFDENGKLIKIIGLLHDVTNETLALESAARLGENLETIQKTSKIVIATEKDDFYTFTSEIYNILEIESDTYPEGVDLIKMCSTPESKDNYKKSIINLTPNNPSSNNLTTIITPTGKKKVLEYYLRAKFDKKTNEKVEVIAFIHEITERVEREKELEQLGEDRKILLQEVHHRVKNNLQIILSFLNLESRYNNNPEYVIEQTQNRIRTMALTHEEVYQSPSVSKINLEHFLTTGMENLFQLYTAGNISLHFDIEPIEIDMDKSIPLGLLINEVALNTIKYAFPEHKEGNFFIDLKQDSDNLIIMKVWDDGIGLPEGVDLFTSDSLGFIIIRNLTQQLEADLRLLNFRRGFGLELKFKE